MPPMDEKPDNKRHAVTISGYYVSEISTAAATQRIYHYQVNIDPPQKNRQRGYARELHICERVKQITEIDKQASLPDQKATAITANSAGVKRIRLSHKTLRSTLEAIPGLKTLQNIKEALVLSSVKARLKRISRNAVNACHATFKRLPGVRKRFAPAGISTQPRRRLFAARPAWLARPVAVILATLILSAGLFYLLPRHTDPVPPAGVKPPPAAPMSRDKTPPDYHAVIEKTDTGVVITLQGPDREEVLTELPPGYHPVLDGNRIVHIVTPGNTLWFIAKRYIKNPYRYPELARLNKIKNPDLIYPGERVVIQYLRKP